MRVARLPGSWASLVLLVTACSTARAPQTAAPGPPPEASIEKLVEYDARLPLDVQARLVREEGAAKVYDVTYASPKGGRVTAFLVTPRTPGTYAGILFGHWGGGNRTEFLAEAVQLAAGGVVSLLPDYPWTRPEPWRKYLSYSSGPEKDLPIYGQALVDLRRGIDLLLSRGDVDPARIAYVGHSYGAQWGAILAAHDRRMKTAILVAGVPDQHALYGESDDPDYVEARRERPEKVARLMEVLGPLEAARHVGRAAPIPLFFQFARFEPYFDEQAMRRYFDAASQPKEIRWYPTGHELNDPRANADRAAWLARHVGLSLPVAMSDPESTEASPVVSNAPPLIARTTPSADGTPIFFVDSGNGDEALVLVHGGLVDHRVYRNQMPLGRTIRVVALDLGGHGISGHGRKDWTLPAMGADVVAVVRALGLTRVVLAGSSMGGPVALEAARQLPGVAAGVIGVDSLHDPRGRPDPAAWKAYVDGFRKDFSAAREGMLKRLFHPDADPDVVEELRRAASQADARVLPPLLDLFGAYDKGRALTEARVPVRCLNGDLYPTNVEANRRYDPTFEAVIFPRTGHYPMLERTEDFNRELLRLTRELLTRLPAPKAGEDTRRTRELFRERHAGRLARDLSELLRFRTARPEGETDWEAPEFVRQRAWLSSKARELGLPFTSHGGRVEEVTLDGSSRAVALVAHGDVVDADERGWSSPPWEGRVLGDRVVGRGAMDDKGPIVSALHAMAALKEGGARTPTVKLLIPEAEETDWSDVAYYLERNPAPDVAIGLDGTFTVTHAQKAAARVVVKSVVGTSSSGGRFRVVSLEGGVAPNVIPGRAEAKVEGPGAELESALRDFSATHPRSRVTVSADGEAWRVEARGIEGHAAIPGNAHNALGDLVAFLATLPLALDGRGTLAAFLGSAVGDETDGRRLGVAHRDDLMGALTVNLGVVREESGTPTAYLDLRVPRGLDGPALDAPVRATAGAFRERTGGRLDVRAQMSKHGPYLVDPGAPHVKALMKVWTDVTGKPARLWVTGGGTQARLFPGGIDFGPALSVEEDRSHQADEHMTVSELTLMGELLIAAILELREADGPS